MCFYLAHFTCFIFFIIISHWGEQINWNYAKTKKKTGQTLQQNKSDMVSLVMGTKEGEE